MDYISSAARSYNITKTTNVLKNVFFKERPYQICDQRKRARLFRWKYFCLLLSMDVRGFVEELLQLTRNR